MQRPKPLNKRIIAEIKRRLAKGAKQYGPEIYNTDPRDWLTESTEEALDQCVYLSLQHFRMLESREYYFIKMQNAVETLQWISEHSKDYAAQKKAKAFLEGFENFE